MVTTYGYINWKCYILKKWYTIQQFSYILPNGYIRIFWMVIAYSSHWLYFGKEIAFVFWQDIAFMFEVFSSICEGTYEKCVLKKMSEHYGGGWFV